MKIASSTIYFSYSQFMVFDRSVKLPGCAWTAHHTDQGFARRESNVCFRTMAEFGNGDAAVHLGPYVEKIGDGRVIEVPFEVISGEVNVEGPEECKDRGVSMPNGHYRLVAAQALLGEDHEVIDLYFERLANPLSNSRIIVADDALHPPSQLLETAEIA
jgi:hypothetical protein